MNKRKELYALHRGSFSEDGLGPFLNVLTYGRGKLNTYPLPDGKVPEIVTKEPWDGEDAPPVSIAFQCCCSHTYLLAVRR